MSEAGNPAALSGKAALVTGATGGIGRATAQAQISPDEFKRSLAVNLRGTFLTVRAFLPGLKRRGSGTVIQVGSVAGRRAFPGNGAYSASKFGVRGFHEVLLEELRGTGVCATLLEPAATNTSIWDSIEPERRPDVPDRESMLDPGSVAACVVFVAARNARVQIPYLTVEAI